jgi:beta-lactamase regulating signal transducer with metallopeptidase domain
MNAAAEWFLDGRATLGLANLALAATLAAGLGLAVNRAFRRQSAASRYVLLIAAMAVALLSPGLIFLAGRASLGAFRVPIASRSAGHDTVGGRTSSSIPVEADAVAPAAGDETALEEGDLSDSSRIGAAQAGGHYSLARESGRVDRSEASALRSASLIGVVGAALCGAWCFGTLAAAAMLMRGLVLAARLKNGLLPTGDPRLREAAESAGRSLGLRRAARILISPLSPVPLSIGLRRPVIAMPAGLAGELSDAELQAVVLHESAHILHRDHWIGLAQRMLGVAFWWNPLVHWLNRRISETREEVCDARVLGLIGQGRLFARCLLKIAAHLQGMRVAPPAVGLVQRPREALEFRVRRLLEGPSGRLDMVRGRLAAIAACFVLAATAGILAAHVRVDDRADQLPAAANESRPGLPAAREYRRAIDMPGTTRVVDASAGDDAGDGSASRPFRTIARGVKALLPGDRLLVREGIYDERVRIDANGAAEAPILLQAEAGHRVIVRSVDSQPVFAIGAGAGHVMIDGFEIRAGRDGASQTAVATSSAGAHRVEITNCVLAGTSVSLRSVIGGVARRCLQFGASQPGVTLVGCKDFTIEECDISGDTMAGVFVSAGCENVGLFRNFIHDGRRDDSASVGVNVSGGVKNIRIEDNLLMRLMAGIDVRDATAGRIVNNFIACTFATGISLGYRSANDFELIHNTVAYTGYRAIVFDGRDIRLRNNVFTAGGDGKLFVAPSDVNWESDYNLFWKCPLVQHSASPGQDAHSRDADPCFRAAPPLVCRGVYYIQVFGQNKTPQCSPGRFYLAQTPVREHFQAGDHVEVDYDGVARTVTEATDEYVCFQPALSQVHPKGWHAVVNWKERSDFGWDLRLRGDSPGKGMGGDGRDAGSDIDFQAYGKGDFDGDGRRDLPPVPAGGSAESGPSGEDLPRLTSNGSNVHA